MPDHAPLRPGDPATVGGYRLTGRLGEGGQGIVYLATAADGTRVAVKLLRADLVGDAQASERFVREVAMARRVAPFCTAQVIETGLSDGRPYIVSEYIDGRTLSDVVRDQGPRTGTALHRLAIGTVTALVAIHQAGIVHRDFKPSNVVLAPDGPRVIDFGIAKALDLASTLTSAVVGTPSYMAPEQLGDEGPGPKSDMFAWAGTIVFAASGRPPFGQDSVAAVVNRILHAEADVSCIGDPALRALVSECLAKDPDSRPAADEALLRLLGHVPAAPRHPFPPQPAGRPAAHPSAPQASPPQASSPQASPPQASSPQAPPPQASPLPGSPPPNPPSQSPPPQDPSSQGLASQAVPRQGLLLEGSAASRNTPSEHSGPGAGGAATPAGPHDQAASSAVPGGRSAPAAPEGRGTSPAPSGGPERAARRRRAALVVAGVTAGLLGLAAAATLVAVRLNAPPPPTTGPTPSAAAVTTAATADAPGVRTYTLPGTSVEVRESDADPVKLVSYTLGGGKRLYVRKHDTNEFAPEERYFEYALDPRTDLALATDVDYSTDLFSTVSIVDHRTGTKRVVKLSQRPVFPTTPRWSPDGERGLVTLYKGEGDTVRTYGFGIIDVAAGRGEVYEVREKGAGEWRFFWDAGGRAVGTWAGGAMTFYGLDGKVLRTLKDAGSPVWVEGDDVSPSGGRFLAHCTPEGTAVCVRPTAGGDPVTVPIAAERLIGWWDDDHLAVWRRAGDGYEAVVVDLKGRVGRVLAKAPDKAQFDAMGFRFARPTA